MQESSLFNYYMKPATAPVTYPPFPLMLISNGGTHKKQSDNTTDNTTSSFSIDEICRRMLESSDL